jgi:hypothetical protein
VPSSPPREPAAPVWPIIRDALANAGPELRRLIRMVVVFWILMFILQVWDSRNSEGPLGLAEFLSVFLGITGIGLLGLAQTLRLSMEEAAARTPAMRDHPAVARVLLALPAVGFAAGVTLASATLLTVMRGVLGTELPLVIGGTLLYGAFTIVAARTVMLSARTLFTFATQQAEAAATLRTAATAARLEALQARMNPHMLFNALNTVATLVRSNPPAAERVVENLADVLRQTLDRSAIAMGTVGDEVAYVRACLALEEERWGTSLRVSWSVPEDVLTTPMPPFVVQPLVENALRHGLGARLEGGRIEISIRRDGTAVVTTVKDDGPGFRPGWTEGVGLGNLRQRLKALYGDRASLSIETTPGGSEVTVIVNGEMRT